MLKDIDVDSLQLRGMGGSVYGETYQQPSFPDLDEIKKVLNVQEGMKIYHGNCHCKAITYSVVTKPLEEQQVLSCNCSLCSKVCSLPPLLLMLRCWSDIAWWYLYLPQEKSGRCSHGRWAAHSLCVLVWWFSSLVLSYLWSQCLGSGVGWGWG